MVVSAGISARFEGCHAHSPPAVRLQVWVDVLAIVRVVHSSSLSCLLGLYLFGQNANYLTTVASALESLCPAPVLHPMDRRVTCGVLIVAQVNKWRQRCS